jgi:hypothetical protein
MHCCYTAVGGGHGERQLAEEEEIVSRLTGRVNVRALPLATLTCIVCRAHRERYV